MRSRTRHTAPVTIDPAVLTGPATAGLREAAGRVVDSGGDVEHLLRSFPDTDRELARQILLQATLRRRAASKLGPMADRMCLTRDGLEQATHPAVATRRARLLRRAGIRAFCDLGCGLGVDSMAAARAGLDVAAIERDAVTAGFARHNIAAAAPDSCVRVVVGDATEAGASGPDRWEASDGETAWFVDPSRRAGYRADGTAHRSARPDTWHPPWSWVVALAARHAAVVAKTAPGIPHDVLPAHAAVEWVSVARQLAEATVWFGDLASLRPMRAAVLLTSAADPWDAPVERVITGTPQRRQAAAGPLGSWLLEPDPAIIRSHLIAELCERIGGRLVSPGIAYVTMDERPDGGFGRVDRVLEMLPARPKPLREALRHRGVASVEIRTRGLAMDPERLRRELRLSGRGDPANLVLTRLGGRAAAILVEP